MFIAAERQYRPGRSMYIFIWRARLISAAGASLAALAALAFWTAATAFAELPRVSPGRLLFGQSAALSGPASELGGEMRRGIEAAFAEANRAGGVSGIRLELLSYDDRYEPEAAIANTKRLISEDKIFALIGAVGTPTSLAAEPIAAKFGVPFIAPFTGAEFLRDPKLSNVVNVRASYFEETEKIVDSLLRERGITRIAALYQDDSYGRAGLQGVRDALRRRDLSLVATGTYARNTTAVKTALLSLRDADPQAIVVIGAYWPSAVFTQWARKLGVQAAILNISFVGSNALAASLGPAGAGVYVTQVVPFPNGDAIPLLRRYRTALHAHSPAADPDFVSLEGYIAGRLTVEVLRHAGPEPTREGFLRTLVRIGSFDLDGFVLRYGPDDNRGSNQVFLTEILDDGRIVPVERLAQ
jgi:ABC-type branched-subunit amino acid transport system substrate-binding protein